MSIYYLLATFGFDTAENEPFEVWRYGVRTPLPPSGVNRRNKYRSGDFRGFCEENAKRLFETGVRRCPIRKYPNGEAALVGRYRTRRDELRLHFLGRDNPESDIYGNRDRLWRP